jgi:hypothetical protein
MTPLMWAALIIASSSLVFPQERPSNAEIFSQQYFPAHTWHAEASKDAFVVDWYSKHLTALQEPSLWEISKSSKQQIYRFLWLRSFHAPIAVRLNINADGTAILTTKITNGKGGYEAGRLTQNKSKKLSKDQTQWFLDGVEELEYWKVPSMEEEDPQFVRVDGAQWIMEAVKDGTYKIVDRWSPEKGPIRVLGLIMLIDLAKLKLLFQDVY